MCICHIFVRPVHSCADGHWVISHLGYCEQCCKERRSAGWHTGFISPASTPRRTITMSRGSLLWDPVPLCATGCLELALQTRLALDLCFSSFCSPGAENSGTSSKLSSVILFAILWRILHTIAHKDYTNLYSPKLRDKGLFWPLSHRSSPFILKSLGDSLLNTNRNKM